MSPPDPRVELAVAPARAAQGVVACVDARGVSVGRAAATAEGTLTLTASHRVEFASGAEDPSLRPETVADALASALREAGLGRRVAVLSLVDDLFGAALGAWTTGLARDAEEVLVTRRVRDVVESSKVPLIASSCPTADDEGGSAQAFFAWVTEPYARSLQRALASQRLLVEQVVPRSIALLELYAASPLGHTDTSLLAGLADRHLVIGAYREDRPVYVRFLRNVLPADGDDEERHSAALSEIRRTIAFFKENHRGRGIDRVAVHGDGTDGLAAMISPLLGIDDVVEFGAGVDAAHVHLLALIHLRAAARRSFSLLPDRGGVSRRRVAAVAAVVLGLAAWTWNLVEIEQEVLAAAEKTVSDLGERVRAEGRDWAQVASDLEQRREDAVRVRTLDAADVIRRDPAGVLLDATAALPDGAELRDLALDNRYGDDEGARVLRMTVVTRADGVADVDAYVETLRRRPWCLAVWSGDDRASLDARRRLQDAGEPVTASIEVALR